MIEANSCEGLYGLGGMLEYFGQLFFLLGGPFAQHIIYLLAFVEVIADTNAQASVVIASGHLVDVLEAIVATITAFTAQALLAEVQVEIIDNYQNPIFIDFFLLHPVAYGFSAPVHKGRGFEQDEGSAFVFDTGEVAEVIGFEGSFGGFCHKIHHIKTNIVAGVIVFGAHITQANN